MKNKEVEIRIVDLLAALLKAARPILCFALILTLLGAGYGLRKARGYTKTETGEFEAVLMAKGNVDTAKERLELARKALKRFNEVEYPSAETKCKQAERMVEQRQDYLDNSLYQALDPFNCGLSTLTFCVESEGEMTVNPATPWLAVDPSAIITMACTQMTAHDDELLNHVRDMMGTDAETRFVNELIYVNRVSDQIVEIRVYHDDAQVAERVVDYIYQTMIGRLKDSMGEFNASVISRFTGYDVSWTIHDRQISNEDKLLTAERALTDAEAQRTMLLDMSLEKEAAVQNAMKLLEKAKGDLRSTKVKTQYPYAVYAAIFMAAGLILGCVAAVFCAIVSGRLQNQSTVLGRYSFPILGILPSRKKRWFARTIRALEGDPQTAFEPAACVAAQSILDLSAGKKSCLVSSLGSGAADDLAPYLNGKLTVCGDVLRDSAAVKTLADFDSVVLVEKRGTSRLDQIDGEVVQLQTLGKEILGIVLL